MAAASTATDPLLDQSSDALSLFTYTPGTATFTDPDGDALSYSARLGSGAPLPAWLQFTPASMTFSGTPGAAATGTYVIELSASDPHGEIASDQFLLTVNAVPSSSGEPISGTDGKDTLTGTPGNDVIIGKAGADTLNGGAGDDVLDGGAGRDVLTGGPGADTFRFSDVRDSYRNYNSGGINAGDIITDFVTGSDRLDLSGLGFSGLGNGYNDTLELIANADGSRTYLKSRNADSSGNRFEVGLNGDLSTLGGADIVWGAAGGGEPTVLFLPALGQSNAKGLRNYGGDGQSGISEMIEDLEHYTGLDVYSLFKDGDGMFIDLAVGDSSVTGLSTASAAMRAKTWWFTDTDQPGDALLRAVPILQSQLASLQELGEVKTGLIWSQGEGNVEAIALATDKVAATNIYRVHTGKVLDYLQANLDGEATVYLMQTGRFQAQAAANRGDSPQKIQAFTQGVAHVRAAQQQLADVRGDVELAVDYADLPMAYELAPQSYPQDVWHLADESREIVGQRLADFIAEDLGYQSDPSDNYPSPAGIVTSSDGGGSGVAVTLPAGMPDPGTVLLAAVPLLVAAGGLGVRRLRKGAGCR